MTIIDYSRTRIDRETLDFQVPACMLWPLPDEAALSLPASGEGKHSPRMDAWQDGRCGLCGATGHRLLMDHSHYTGFIRGKVCRGCNVSEGTGNDAPYLTRWRAGWNPAALLGIQHEYRDITGQLVLNEEGLRLRMTDVERRAYDADKKRRMRAAIDTLRCLPALVTIAILGTGWVSMLLTGSGWAA